MANGLSIVFPVDKKTSISQTFEGSTIFGWFFGANHRGLVCSTVPRIQ
jgi:hypothetical protein